MYVDIYLLYVFNSQTGGTDRNQSGGSLHAERVISHRRDIAAEYARVASASRRPNSQDAQWMIMVPRCVINYDATTRSRKQSYLFLV